jgi:hypothetical protein
MKKQQISVIIGLFIAIALAFGANTVFSVWKNYRLYDAHPEILIAEAQEKVDNTHVLNAVLRSIAIIGPLMLLLLGSYYILNRGLCEREKASVHTIKLGEHKEIPVRKKDLGIAVPLSMGLMAAEQTRTVNEGTLQGAEAAVKIYKEIAGTANKAGLKQIEQAAPAMLTGPKRVPTFAHLLRRGEIAPDEPMILGFEHGEPRRGSFLNIYSAAIAGESGSGKTSTMLFLLGSGIITEGVRFYGIDPHYPHPNSLGFKTKPLWEAGLMQMATYKDDMTTMLTAVETIINNRLKQIDLDTTPVVLVIDELAFLSKTTMGSHIAYTMERISTEGRKCQVYMLASSQTWLASRTGGDSTVRDTLTSAYIHRIKPKQANLLLQDKDAIRLLKTSVKEPGDVLFWPVCDDPILAKIPEVKDDDMRLVVEASTRGQAASTPQIPASTGVHTDADDLFDGLSDERKVFAFEIQRPEDVTLDLVRHKIAALKRATPTLADAQIAEWCGMDRSTFRKVLEAERPLSTERQQKMYAGLFIRDLMSTAG